MRIQVEDFKSTQWVYTRTRFFIFRRQWVLSGGNWHLINAHDGHEEGMEIGGSSISADMTTKEIPTMKISTQMTSATPMSSSAPTSIMASMSSKQEMRSLDPRGCTPPMIFRPGYNVNPLPPATFASTKSSLTIPAKLTHAHGWLALNLVNSGAVTKLGISLDAHSILLCCRRSLCYLKGGQGQLKKKNSMVVYPAWINTARSRTSLLANVIRSSSSWTKRLVSIMFDSRRV